MVRNAFIYYQFLLITDYKVYTFSGKKTDLVTKTRLNKIKLAWVYEDEEKTNESKTEKNSTVNQADILKILTQRFNIS